jgi:two-component system alkaline phosphatase synthesis response regulator PhoP
MMRRILVTQSDSEATQEVTSVLMEQGFEVENAYNIEEALQKVKSEPWDLVVLDIRAPQGDGFEACQYVREYTTTPVVILSTLGQDEHIVEGLNAGADDYLVKPISAEVFLAHVYALLRRAGRMRERAQNGVLKQGDLVIDFDRHEVSVQGELLQLTSTEFRLLSCLTKNPGRVLSSRSLVREVQGYDCSPEEAREIIKVHIHNLRKKMRLSSKKPPYIVNVRGVGYVFERRGSPREESTNRILT